MSNPLFCRIGVFYDGAFFQMVSNYYATVDKRRTRIDIEGLHKLIRTTVSKKEAIEERLCQIVDAHYFKGRLSAKDIKTQGDLLYSERVFEDILTDCAITPHYLPLLTLPNGQKQEKGIDVWLALEAYEQTVFKKYDIVVLVAGDGDYVPLVRKLNTLGVRVMLIGWNLKYPTPHGNFFEIRTAQSLLSEVSYPIMVSTLLEQDSDASDPIIQGLFLKNNICPEGYKNKYQGSTSTIHTQANALCTDQEGCSNREPMAERNNSSTLISEKEIQEELAPLPPGRHEGRMQNIMADFSFAFIETALFPKNLFCHHSGVPIGLSQLRIGQAVSFALGRNQNGQPMAIQVEPISIYSVETESTNTPT